MPSTNGSTPPIDDKSPSMQVNVIGQFIEDLSFENIALQEGRLGRAAPSEIEVQVGVDIKKTGNLTYKVTIKLKLNAVGKEEGSVLFILELDYVGLFKVIEADDETLKMVLMVECPRLLFPFVRRIAANLTQDAGYPPVNLDPIDFQSLYRESDTKDSKLEM